MFERGILFNQLHAAESLAQFVMELRWLEPAGAPRSSLDKPSRMRDTDIRNAISSLQGIIDYEVAIAAWEKSQQAPEWERPMVWTHGDLLPPNLLIEVGWLTGVKDFINTWLGDPGADIIASWIVFVKDARQLF